MPLVLLLRLHMFPFALLREGLGGEACGSNAETCLGMAGIAIALYELLLV